MLSYFKKLIVISKITSIYAIESSDKTNKLIELEEKKIENLGEKNLLDDKKEQEMIQRIEKKLKETY